jgi:hypothetical protein
VKDERRHQSSQLVDVEVGRGRQGFGQLEVLVGPAKVGSQARPFKRGTATSFG